ncbi:MAG: PEGA domain-containing protein [Methanoregula sp.]
MKNPVKTVLCILLFLVIVQGVQAAETYLYVAKWGSMGTGDGQFLSPEAVAIDRSGNIYVTDPQNNRVSKFTPEGQYILGWGSKGLLAGQFNESNGIAVDANGNVYVTDRYNHRVQKFSSTGTYLTAWGSYGTGNGQFNDPFAVAVDSQGNVYVTDHYNHRVQKFSPTGQFITAWGSFGTGDGQFSIPLGIAVDASDNVYVVDYNTYRVQKFTSSGQFITRWEGPAYGGQGLKGFIGIAVDATGNVYISEIWDSHVYKYSPAGVLLTRFGTPGKGDGQFSNPISDIAVDSSGNVYLIDRNNARVQKFSSSPLPASLAISSDPTGAQVSSDGVYKGITPVTVTNIVPGTHTYTFSKSGYVTQSTVYTSASGEAGSMSTRLKKSDEVLPAQITITSDPTGAAVLLDDVYKGITPITVTNIVPGTYTYTFSKSGYVTQSTVYTSASGESASMHTTLKVNTPLDTVVFVNSVPDGANVYIDDVYKGVTPTSLHLKQGTYILKLTNENYADDESLLHIGSADPIQVTRTLSGPEPTPGFEGFLAVISLIAVVLFARKFR